MKMKFGNLQNAPKQTTTY